MNKKVKAVIIFALIVYFFNFFWEFFHGYFLYQGFKTIDKDYLKMISFCALKDMLILLSIFGLGVLFWKEFWWFKEMNRVKYSYFFISSIAVAVVIEIKAVYIFHQWSYSEFMPIVFGVGLSPLLQLFTTGLLSLKITTKSFNS